MSADRSHGERPAAEAEKVVIRDNRKIDPVTGEVRKPGSAPAEPGPGAISSEEEVPKAEALLLEERTQDLQRVQAEYANYRRRAERERLAAGDLGVGRVLTELLPILDDLDRAREHGDLTGGLKAVADKLETAVAKLGLVPFGEEGDPFDPTIHEAVLHNESPDVTEPTATTIMRKGYKHGERLLRAAMVGVSDPAEPAGSETAGSETAGSETAGSETAGSETAGSHRAGSRTAGSKRAGSGRAASGRTGSEEPLGDEPADAETDE